MRRYIYLLTTFVIILVGLCHELKAQLLPDTLSSRAVMSILVASPSDEEAYTMYGHAGYRVYDAEQSLDITFNYGIFQFDDTFIWRFIKGKTDYLVLPQRSEDYMSEYLGRGSRVDELLLNLRPDEKQRVWDYLKWNIQPDHRVYRYNFFKDNCATRPLWLVDMAVGGLVYPKSGDDATGQRETWRKEINSLEASSPWLVLGTDLAVGSPADEVMSLKDKAFSPRQLVGILNVVKRHDGSSVLQSVVPYEPYTVAKPEWSLWNIFSPLVCVAVLLVLVIYLYLYRLCRQAKRVPLFLDAVIYSAIGLSGILLCYISLLSEHPFVSPNYNIILFNPLHLVVGLPLLLVSRWQVARLCYHFVTFASVCAFIFVALFLPQHINSAVFLLAVAVGIMSATRLVGYVRTKRSHGTY